MKKIILLVMFFISSTNVWSQSNLGYLDTTFNIKGPIKGQKLVSNLVGEARALAIDDQGRIVVAACSTNFSPYINVFRLKSDGTLDNSFGSAITDTVKINMTSFGSNAFSSSLTFQKDGKILIGGNMDNNTMLVIRLNSNGSRDTTFDKDGILIIDQSAGAPDQVNNIAVQSNGKIIISGTSAGKITVLRRNPDGSPETGFSSFTSTNAFTETAGGLEIINDTILIGGSYTNTSGAAPIYYYSVIKFLQNGQIIWRKDVVLSPNPSTSNIGNIAVQPDGKIIIAGSDYAAFRAYRLNTDGSIDNSFAKGAAFLAYLGMGPTLKSIVIEKDGKIDLIGYYNSNYAIARINSSGSTDSTFGLYGQLLINTGSYTSNCAAILSPDQKILMVGANYNTAEIIKVELKPVVHIIGNGYAAPGSIEKYSVQVPPSWGAVIYQWIYSGLYFNYVPSQNSYPLTILFSDTATSGKLTCKITSLAGAVLGSGEMNITINPNASNASQLSKLDCSTSLSDCSLGYIDAFSLNTLSNSNSGCSDNGYSDYTKSDFTDTLAAGGAYAAKLTIPNDGTFASYVGIWIDYNNDGSFSNIDEFVGEGYSRDSKMKVDIFLKNREGYDGAKRLRVRSRPDSAITSNQACPANGEAGETEDYLILLSKQPSLEAPQIITPNDDGFNDYFVVHGVDPNRKNKLTIFDRIGAVKFSTANYENDWNGTDKHGEKLSPGTYYYVFTNDKNSVRGFLEIRY